MHLVFGLLSGASGTADTDAPAADPASPSLYYYAGTLVGVQWTNGDATAQTDIGSSSNRLNEPDEADDTVSAGVSSYETGEPGTITSSGVAPGTYYWVRHKKNGHTTDWVVTTQRRIA